MTKEQVDELIRDWCNGGLEKKYFNEMFEII